MSYFVEDLLEKIKRRSFAPISQGTYQDSGLIAIANEELDLNLVANLVEEREDFFLTTEDTEISANISHYSIPSRAIGNTLKTLFYVNQDGKMSEMRLIDPSRRDEFPLTGPLPSAFYFEGDEIVLVPTPNVTEGALRFSFPAKPNQLIATSSCAKITSISTSPTTASFSVNTDLTASLSVGSYVDFLSVVSPFKLWAYRLPITQITSTQIDVDISGVLDDAGVNVEPQVDDYICPSGFSNIPQIPTAYHPVLAQMSVLTILEGLGDLNKLARAQATLEKLEKNAKSLIKNRVETTPKKASGRNSLVKYFN